MTTRDGLAITVVSTVACWLVFVTAADAWGARQAEAVLRYTSAIGVLATGLAVWVGTDATRDAD